MSRLLRIGFVVEGVTDYYTLDALVERFLNGTDYLSTQIQPPSSEYANQQGPLGGGWRGVLRWCESMGQEPEGFLASLPVSNYDCLIIHLDADIAHESDLRPFALLSPCPPAQETCDKIRTHLTQLLGGALPDKILFCVPAQCIEAWIFAALHSDLVSSFEPIECRDEVERLLIQKPDRLVRDKSGSAKKQTDRYRSVAPKIAAQWENAKRYCEEAKRFEQECQAVLQKAVIVISS